MKHIKKFKLFESNDDPGSYLNGDVVYIKVNYDVCLYFSDSGKILEDELPESEKSRLKRVIDILHKKSGLVHLRGDFDYYENSDQIYCIYCDLLHIVKSKQLLVFELSKLVDDYYIVTLVTYENYDDEKGTYYETYNPRCEWILCDGLHGLKKWAEEYII